MLKLLLYDAQSWIETPLLWPTEIWLLLHGRKLKEETTFDLDAAAVPIGHEETTPVVSVHLGLKTPGRLAGAGSRGYGPGLCYNRALMLAAPDETNYYRRCSPLKLLNLDYIQHFSYGARGFIARPSERSERLKLFVYAQHGHELMG